MNPRLLPTTEIATMRCVVLLGEAGLGKTYSVELLGHIAPTDPLDASLTDDLAQYESDSGVMLGSFQSQALRDWRRGAGTLTLLLDGLDECRVSVASLSSLLANQLMALPTARLRLRIACRTAIWIGSFRRLEGSLAKQFGEVEVYELVPLRKSDVSQAARENGLDADAFIGAITTRDVVPLACRPVTLQLLIQEYLKSQQLPESKQKLYEFGLRGLASEQSKSRQDSGRDGKLTAEQRVAIAARIAAAMTFGGHVRIGLRDAGVGHRSKEDVHVRDLIGGVEQARDEQVDVTIDALQECIDTGLFTGMGSDHVAFAHHSYQEFLAAAFLLQRRVSDFELVSVLQLDSAGRIAPQLIEVATWVCMTRTDLRRRFIASEPALVLNADTSRLPESERLELTIAILNAFRAGELADLWWSPRAYYAQLNHPQIAAALRAPISDVSEPIPVRLTAIAIAEACAVSELEELLVERALDAQDGIEVRESAAAVVARSSVPALRERLRALLRVPPSDDPDDELRGAALRALWPSHLTAAELFNLLTTPQRENYTGAYSMFLVHELLDDLADSDLTSAIAWVQRERQRWFQFGALAQLGSGILERAVDRLDQAEIATAFAAAIIDQIREHSYGDLFDSSSSWPEARRRRLIDALMPHMTAQSHDADFVTQHPVKLLQTTDVEWIIERMREAAESSKTVWAGLLVNVYDRSDLSQVDAVLQAFESWPLDACPLRRFVEFGSPEERASRNAAAAAAAHSRQPRVSRVKAPMKWEDIEVLFAGVEPPLKLWTIIYHQLVADPFAPLRSSSRWHDATADQRRLVLDLARRVIAEADANVLSGVWTRRITGSQGAAYEALALLFAHDRAFLDTLPDLTWASWAPLAYRIPIADDSDESDSELLRLAYSRAPDAVCRFLELRVRCEIDPVHVQVELRRTDLIWNEALANFLLGLANLQPIPWQVRVEVLRALIQHDHPAATALALALVADADVDLAVSISLALLDSAPSQAWPTIWTRMQAESGFGEHLMLAYPRGVDVFQPRIARQLSERDLDLLYRWLREHFAAETDHGSDSPHDVQRRHLGYVRNALLHGLKDRGTSESLEVLNALAEEFPPLRGLRTRRARDGECALGRQLQ